MLVVISDLHLTDGTTGDTVAPGVFSLFSERLAELAIAAGHRADGSYRPVEQFDVVLLGDTFDVIRSTQWHESQTVRPWDNPQSAEFLTRVAKITAEILRNNEPMLAQFRSLASDGIAVPAEQPAAKSAATAKVAVRFHYMVGNHDWFYHVPGQAYDALREAIVTRMGLANRPTEPFPHDITESEPLLAAMRRHKVLARHGDLFDPLNFEGDRDASSLGDAIVIELVTRFAFEVKSQLGDELPPATAFGLREIDNVRPLLLIPVWIDGLLDRTCPKPATRKRVKAVWDRLVDDFLSVDFVRRRDTWNPNDAVDNLARLLKFSKWISFNWASAIADWLHEIRGAQSDSYSVHALAEPDFRNRRARHVVYGHTHGQESVPLDASFAEGYVLHQTYFNAGTWRRVHRQTQWAPAEHEFIAADEMSYLAFFQGDERKGRPYETWSGTLGSPPLDAPVLRVDSGAANHAQSEPVPTPSVHNLAPHFPAAILKGRAGARRRD